MKKKYIPPIMNVYRLAHTGQLLVGSFDGNSEYPQDIYIVDGQIVNGNEIG